MAKEIKSNRGRKPKTNDYNSVFAQRLRDLIDERNLTLPELAEQLNTTRQSIGQWKNGDTVPNIIMLKTIAEYFNVSADYLIGIEDYKTHEAASVGALTGISEDNIKWLNISIEGYNEYPNPAQKKFFDTLNSLLDTLREHSIIHTLMHLYAQTKMFKNAFKRIENNIDNNTDVNISENVALFSTIHNINAEKDMIVDILTYSLHNIIGYSAEEYRYYCNKLNEYSVTYGDWTKDIENAEEFIEIERLYKKHYGLEVAENGNDTETR